MSPAAPPASAPTRPAAEITPQVRTAIARGLAWLAKQQNPDGSWQGSYGANTGVASLIVLSFLSTGHLPDRGPHGKLVARGIDFVLAHAQPSGLISNPADTSNGPMYEHGLSTLMLAEVWGEYEKPGLRDTLRRAVELIVACQNREGGWRYQPRPVDADVSVTVMQVMALRAASSAGLTVPRRTMEAARAYVRRCATPGGGFQYQPGAGAVAYSRTAAGVCALLAGGDAGSEEVIRGIGYLQANKAPQRRGPLFVFYALYYAAQAMALAPSPAGRGRAGVGGLTTEPSEWSQWFPPIRDELLALQQPDGHWDGEAGPLYGTSIALLVLSLPDRYLPVHQH